MQSPLVMPSASYRAAARLIFVPTALLLLCLPHLSHAAPAQPIAADPPAVAGPAVPTPPAAVPALPVAGTGHTYYVALSGKDSNPGTLAAPFLTIQAAIDAAVSKDTIIVEDGTYSGVGNVDLDFRGRNITVTSQNGAVTTIINCLGSSSTDHRGFNLHTGETKAVINGLTIKNGYESNGNGGAIYSEVPLTVSNCTLTSNKARSGGGIFSGNNHIGSLTVTKCTLTSNSADGGGGGIQSNFPGGTITLADCTITGSTGDGLKNDNFMGGTVTLTSCKLTKNTGDGLKNDNLGGGTVIATGCTFTGNSGIAINNDNLQGGKVLVTNCTITDNVGGGIKNGNVVNGTITLTGCRLTGNSGKGIANDNVQGGKVTLTNSTLDDNSANTDNGIHTN